MSRLGWIALAIGLVVALLAFATRRPRESRAARQVGSGANGNATRDAIAAAVRSGRKLEAIKLLRERTGMGLAEAKAAVEAMQADPTRLEAIDAGASERRPDDPASVPGVEAALAAGDPIEAIKRYREHAGVGLKEAKQAIDALRARR